MLAGDGAGAGAEVDDERVGGVAKVGGDPVGELFGFGSGDEYSGSDGEGEGAEGGGAEDVLEGFSVGAPADEFGIVGVEGGGEVVWWHEPHGERVGADEVGGERVCVVTWGGHTGCCQGGLRYAQYFVHVCEPVLIRLRVGRRVPRFGAR